MKLWPQQEFGLSEIDRLVKAGRKRIVLVSPTGGGKTKLAIERMIASEVPSSFYTHRRMLLGQTGARFEEAGLDYGFRASKMDENLDAQIQLAMIQSEASAIYRKKRRSLHNAKEILIDEAHANSNGVIETIIDDHNCVTIGLTATPLGIGHIYEDMVIAGTNSELRACGSHVIAHTFGPSEPDTRIVGKVKIGEGECGITQAKRSVYSHKVFGDVVEHYRKLNPGGKPALLFAPGVQESIWFCEQLNDMGISAAHIDGGDCWLDGELVPSSQEIREEIEHRCQSGDIKIVCNRFVLREGVDWPFIYHGIFATIFGSLTAYLQAGGRIIRNHPSMDHCCVARGTLILTDRGEVPIEQVKRTDLVWDGVEFVKHDGAVCNDTKEVIQWEGLLLTPDHKVLTKNGWKEAGEAKASCCGSVVSGVGGRPVWTADDSNPYGPRQRTEVGSRGRLFKVWESGLAFLSQNVKADSAGLRALHEYLWGSLPGMAMASGSASAPTLSMPSEQYVSPLWWPRHRVPIFDNIRGCLLDCGESWLAQGFKNDLGSYRQQRTLRARKFEMGESKRANGKPRKVHTAEFSLSSIYKGLSRCFLLQELPGGSLQEGLDRGADSRPLEKEVWDIVNCGPRNRYTANGVVVGNCIQDHGGNWWRHGSLNADREWRLEYTDRIIGEMRLERIRQDKEREPIHCAKCNAIRLAGKKCWECGYQFQKRTRPVLQSNGSLKEMTNATFKPKRRAERTENIEKQWIGRVLGVKRSKKDSVKRMTFAQLQANFARENDWYYPPLDLPMMPTNDMDWFLPVQQVTELTK